MKTIMFAGIRGGHGATTVALKAAQIIFRHDPSLKVKARSHDLSGIEALTGLCNTSGVVAFEKGGLMSNEDMDMDEDVQVREVDFGYLTADYRPADLVLGVLRGPDYTGLKTLIDKPGALDGIILVKEHGRALEKRDIEAVTGLDVVATVDRTERVARSIDAGLLLASRDQEEFIELGSYLVSWVKGEK